MTMFGSNGIVMEIDNEPWFLNKARFNSYIKKITGFADFTVNDCIYKVNEYFPDCKILHTLTYRDIIDSKYTIHAKYGFNTYFICINNMKKFKSNIINNENIPIEFFVPKSDDEIQNAKKLLTMSYASLEPINRKLKWASQSHTDDLLSSSAYINVKFYTQSNKNGFDIKLKCAITNVHETKIVAQQLHDILNHGDVDYQLSKQFLTYINAKTKSQVSRKSFVLYIRDFDVLNNLFFLFNRKDISIETIDFYQKKDKNEFSDYIMRFCEL
jgi:hypothetical protein